MHFTIYLLLGLALLSQVFASPTKHSQLFKAAVKAKRFQDPSPDKIVSTYISMYRTQVARSSPYHEAIRRRSFKTGVTATYAVQQSLIWVAYLKIGKREYPLLVDSGSSDTWVVTESFQCFDQFTAEPKNQEDCMFGPIYPPGEEFKPIADQIFQIVYGSGQFLTGIFGYTKVTLAGISVTQQIGAVDQAGWYGDGISSGLIGLAYPSLTNGFNNTDGLYNASAPNSRVEKQIVYDGLFTTMYKSGKIAPVFSIAISRASPNQEADSSSCDGYLAFGGLPPVKTYGEWARKPIQYVELDKGYYPGSLPYPQYQWYTVTPDAFLFQGIQASTYGGDQWTPLSTLANVSDAQIILDSGTTLNYLPWAVAFKLSSEYQPPAVWDAEMHAFVVDCNAIPPRFAIKIDGVIFEVDRRDMITDDFSGAGTCITGHNPGNPAHPYIIGDVFMKNVLVVFDVGAGELRFRSRGHY